MKDSKKKESIDQLLLWEDFHAKTYPLQEDRKELSESDQVFGRSLRGSSKMYSQRGQLLKMYLPFDLKDLPWSYKISMRSGTMLSGIVYPVPQLVGYTEEIAYGSSQDLNEEQKRDMWATPNTLDHMPPRSKGAMERQFATTRKGRTKPSNLREQVHPDMWPTPRAALGMHMKLTENMAKLRYKKYLETEVAYKFWSTKDQKQIEKKPGHLNPEWVEWLMGYPEDYTLIEDEE